LFFFVRRSSQGRRSMDILPQTKAVPVTKVVPEGRRLLPMMTA
jgi:hypothetical protein